MKLFLHQISIWLCSILSLISVARSQVLVYNRISKAGSSYMSAILSEVAKKKGFKIWHSHHSTYWMDSTELVHELAAMPDKSIYINHVYFVSDDIIRQVQSQQPRAKQSKYDPSRFIWINIVRDPIERMVSSFYYALDTQHRAKEAVTAIQNRMQSLGKCGCYGLEFDYCVKLAFKSRNQKCLREAMSMIEINPQIKFLSNEHDWYNTTYGEPRQGLGAMAALGSKAQKNLPRYLFIGLNR